MKKIEIVLLVLIVILLTFSWYQYKTITRLQKENKLLGGEVSQLSENLVLINDEIGRNINLIDKYQAEIES
jgi:uncharacterized membrane protein